ncbi:hypothetical protein GCM10010394_55140 [Streptomyces crystallinus]|uniref:Uncharacterized protein n=1 Tax=Streptomyces crystallinus TaxID=68191 RepID=A0ABP3RUG4_9ACTN
MKAKGFTYATPWAACISPKWRSSAAESPSRESPHTAKGILAATADANLIGVAVAVEIAYDRQYIEAHAAQLAAFKRRLDDQLGAAARLAGSGPA